ncbi:MAG: 3'(2'),5'-bisphosphate nucleotidase CysQ [Desulfovibrionales bacterium]
MAKGERLDLERMIPYVCGAALEAGERILEIYETDFNVELKEDKSPLTKADRASHEVIKKALKRYPIPVLSEEGRSVPYEERRAWDRLWIVDPLDGTKEFIKRNGEFTVNIALVEQGRPILGVIHVPVKQTSYFAAAGVGSWKVEQITREMTFSGLTALKASGVRLPHFQKTSRPYTVMGSRSHPTPELEAYITRKKEEHPGLVFISAGSSLKFCLVAEGDADMYPRLGPTMEWDTAAGQAVVEQAGGRVVLADDETPLSYNRENLLNPHFIVFGAT